MPAPHLVGFLQQTLFDDPWTDPELPSLVYVDDQGKIVGSITSSTRRMRFDGRSLRAVCSSYFWAHPSMRTHAVGAQLMGALLAGPQDLTISDAASDMSRRMMEALGGRTVHASCFSFYRIFRPWRFGSEFFLGHRRKGPLGTALRPVALALDGITRRVARRALVPREPEGTTERLTPSKMMEHLPSVTSSLRLYPDYDESYLDWLFERLEEIDESLLPWFHGGIERGPVFAELVQKNRQVLGWYVCQLRSAGVCRVLQLAVTERGADAVMDQLFYRAWQEGAAAVLGRVEPHLVGPLMRLRCLVQPSGRVLIHSRDQSLVGAILAGDALLSRIEGEWWASWS